MTKKEKVLKGEIDEEAETAKRFEEATATDALSRAVKAESELKALQAARAAEDEVIARRLADEEAAKVETPSKAEFKRIVEAYKKEKPALYEARKEAIEAKLAKMK